MTFPKTEARTQTNLPMKCLKNGFTLVELLVVIAIVAVLATIAFSVASKALLKAKETTCVGNLKQIGILMSGFAAENNGFYPEAGKPDGYITRLCDKSFPDSVPTPGGPNADQTRERFFKSETAKMFRCPADKTGVANHEKTYLINGRISGVVETANPKSYLGGDGPEAFTPVPTAKIYDPARTFLLIEDWELKTNLWSEEDVHYVTGPNTDAHRGGRHYLFVDGHVEFLIKDPGVDNPRAEAIHYRGKDPDAT